MGRGSCTSYGQSDLFFCCKLYVISPKMRKQLTDRLILIRLISAMLHFPEMDDEDCERRRTECLDEMSDLEKQFTDLKEQYAD